MHFLSMPSATVYNLNFVRHISFSFPPFVTNNRHTNPKHSDRQTCANSADPDHTPQNAASDQGLYCLPCSHSAVLRTSTGNAKVFSNF